MRKIFVALMAMFGVFAVVLGVAAATPYNSDTLVTVGSPPSPFAQNKQNEPAVADQPGGADDCGGGG